MAGRQVVLFGAVVRDVVEFPSLSVVIGSHEFPSSETYHAVSLVFGEDRTDGQPPPFGEGQERDAPRPVPAGALRTARDILSLRRRDRWS